MGGGGVDVKIQLYSETKTDYIFILIFQFFKNLATYKYLKSLTGLWRSPLRGRPGVAIPSTPSLRNWTSEDTYNLFLYV